MMFSASNRYRCPKFSNPITIYSHGSNLYYSQQISHQTYYNIYIYSLPKHQLLEFPEMAMVRALVKERPVVIFSKSSCCMSYTIKTLISSFGANPTVYEMDEHPQGKQIEKELRGLGCKPSVPAVFIGEELIGGANEIMSLHLKGQLVPLLLNANAIWL
ncbi:monothiol glutaredoxin-S2 [Lactuca sativa]|uniref:monothiol glutaredoxin-S2 n=1 Tax=Lactuca sativa TaxID=4236 RepID=UPI001C68B773|nr:monothiol glutaredoxin-S2 [Lactuca sativa]